MRGFGEVALMAGYFQKDTLGVDSSLGRERKPMARNSPRVPICDVMLCQEAMEKLRIVYGRMYEDIPAERISLLRSVAPGAIESLRIVILSSLEAGWRRAERHMFGRRICLWSSGVAACRRWQRCRAGTKHRLPDSALTRL